MNTLSESGDATTSNTVGKERKETNVTKRGIVALKKVIEARRNGTKVKVEFDKLGNAVGETRSTYNDYLGLLGRTKVPLTDNNWKRTAQTIKQAIWEDLQQYFEVDEIVRDMTMKKVGKAAREFRAKLSKRCLDEEGNPNFNAPEKYAQFPTVRDSWKGFVMAHTQEKFQELSQTNANNAKKRKCHHRMGAKGYPQLRKNMEDALQNEPPAKQRMMVWKAARVTKSGNIVDPDVQEVVDKGEAIAETLTTEEMMSEGPNDILAKSVTKEYTGRVLTAGCGVAMKSYYGNKLKPSCEAEVHQLKQMVMQMSVQLAQMKAVQDQSRAHEVQATPTHVPEGLSQKGSCPTFGTEEIPEGQSVLCDLYVEVPTHAKVGSGLAFRQVGHIVHCVPLNANEVQVSITEVVDGHEKTPVPIKNDDAGITTVEEAKGAFVVWPLHLVSLQKKEVINVLVEKSVAMSTTPFSSKTPAYPRNSDLEPSACLFICKMYTTSDKKDDAIPVELIDDAFWCSPYTDYVSGENIKEVLTLGWLSATSISLYIRYLVDTHLLCEDGSARCPGLYSFTSPHNDKNVHAPIVDALAKHEGEDHLVLIPFNIGEHWVLVAINTKNERIYYMDPLRASHTSIQRESLLRTITNAMTSYRGNKSGNTSIGRKKLNKKLDWYTIECPMQPPNSGLCAYYICLFIEDILESKATTVPTRYVQKRRCTHFSDDRIAHVQREWCGYVFNRLLRPNV